MIDAEAHDGPVQQLANTDPPNPQTTRRVEPSYMTTPVRGWQTFSGGYGATRPSANQFPGRLLPDFL